MKYPTHALRRSRLALNKPTAPQNGALEQCRRYTQGTLRGHIHSNPSVPGHYVQSMFMWLSRYRPL